MLRVSVDIYIVESLIELIFLLCWNCTAELKGKNVKGCHVVYLFKVWGWVLLSVMVQIERKEEGGLLRGLI